LGIMGARLNVSSELGVGTVFDFTLKFSKIERPQPSPDTGDQPNEVLTPSAERSDLRILYVEDSETNQLVMSAMMKRMGIELALASSATEGFDALTSEPFDVVITDIQMPEHSGLDLLEWVKSSPRTPNAMRIFACTANAGNDSLNEYERAGFNGVLTKPLDLQTLENFLSNLGE